MIWEIVFVVVAFLLFAGLTYLYYSGLFYPINLKIAKPYDGSLPIAYKYVIGNYYNCGKLFQEFVGATSNDTTLIGMYYDDPDVVDKDKCRHLVGAVLTGKGEQYSDKLRAAGYSFTTVPELDQALFVDFPMVNYLSMLIAVYRVYSTMFSYMKKEGLKHESPMIELYSPKSMRVIAAFKTGPAFHVPEYQ